MKPAPAIPVIISQHAEEAAFQWLLRSGAIHAPHYSLSDLAKLDGIVEAHLDGLRIAGEVGWETCRTELAWQEPGELFTAAALAFDSGLPQRIEPVLAVALASTEAAPGLASALGWLLPQQAQSHITGLLQSDEPLLRRLGLSAAALHRRDPDPVLTAALQADDEIVTPRALRAAGELGRRDLLPQCQAHLNSDHPETRFWAAWAATLLGDTQAAGTLSGLATQPGCRAEQACLTAARGMPPIQALQWQKQLAASGEHRRLAIRAAGAAGDPVLVPWLIEAMADDEHARPAGEAFSFITGLDLAYLDLERDQPEDFEAGPNEDPADENVEPDRDGDLPWPDPVLIAGWWATNRKRFKAGRRYLAGEPIAEKHLRSLLLTGLQRQRAAAALELVLMRPGQPLFEVRARGDRQQRLLAD